MKKKKTLKIPQVTIAIAWIRKIKNHEELVFASDSRLRSYGSWDANPKLFPLERTDCGICFAGDTHYSYPIINQVQNFIKSYPKSSSRFQDIVYFKGQLMSMINHMLEFKSDEEVPLVDFLFGGYSWERRRFKLWRIYYDKNISKFVSPEVHSWKGLKVIRRVSFIGDYHLEYRKRLILLMKEKKKFISGNFDMEPFEVLRDMIREGTFNYIGGPPQCMKVYEHMNRTPIGVKWKINDKQYNTLLGRPLMDTEVNHYPMMDPDTFEIEPGSLFGG